MSALPPGINVDHHSGPIVNPDQLDTASNPPRYLLEFFLHPISELRRPSKSTASTRLSKEPQWFDLHMHKNLRLNQVNIIPDFTERLGTFINRYLYRKNSVYQIPSTDKSIVDDFPSARNISEMLKSGRTHSENSVVSKTDSQIISPCALVASTLLFNTEHWTPILGSSERAADVRQPIAKADAFIFVDRDAKAGANMAKLSPSDRADVDLLYEHGLQNFLLYEFKNLDAGDLKSMTSIVSQTGLFPYTTCTGSECQHLKHLVGGLSAVTGHAVGPDAKYNGIFDLALAPDLPSGVTCPPWDVKTSIDDTLNLNINLEDSGAGAEFAGSNTRPQDIVASAGPSSAHSDNTSKTKSLLDKKKSNHFKKGAGHSTTDNSKFTRDNKRNRVKQLTETKVVKSHMKARHIIQQAWAELVYNDATFMVFSSGNYEIIGMRDRETQTLSLSPLIHTTSLHNRIPHKVVITALMMLAYVDAVDRARQLKGVEDTSLLPVPHCLSFEKSGLIIGNLDTTAQATALSINADLEGELINADCLRVEVPQIYMTQGLSNWTTCEKYNERAHSGNFGPKKKTNTQARLELTIDKTDRLKGHVTQSFKTTRSARVVYYTLSRMAGTGDSTENFTGNIIIKFSTGAPASNRKLEEEYNKYLQLEKSDAKHVIPKIFGFYSFHDSNVRGIIMACTGMSLDFWIHKPLLLKNKVVTKNRDKINGALQTLHKAGWLHNDLQASHVIISPEGKTTFVGIDKASQITSLKKHLSLGNVQGYDIDVQKEERFVLERWTNEPELGTITE